MNTPTHLPVAGLSPTAVHVLSDLAANVAFTRSESHRRRMGANGQDALSQYLYSRWYTWDRKQRLRFKRALPQPLIERALVGWFLALPPGDGFLDRMEAWVGVPMSGTVVAYALNRDQRVLLNDTEVFVPQSEGLIFNLQVVHEIKPSPTGQLWACVMSPYSPQELTACLTAEAKL